MILRRFTFNEFLNIINVTLTSIFIPHCSRTIYYKAIYVSAFQIFASTEEKVQIGDP